MFKWRMEKNGYHKHIWEDQLIVYMDCTKNYNVAVWIDCMEDGIRLFPVIKSRNRDG